MSTEAERAPRGPCSGVEPEVADRVESAMPAEGITPGDRVCHDAQSPKHLRVDFVYPDARPRPLALEVTAIVAPGDIKGSRASQSLSERLSATAEAEGLGAWMVAVRIDRDMRDLESEIIEIIRQAQPVREEMLQSGRFIRPGWYTSDDLPVRRSQWDAYIAEHERLKELGITEVQPIRADRENFIGVLPGRGDIIRPFDEELRERVDAKAEVLGTVGDLERHLAVVVDRWDVSNDPAATAVPTLPPTVDVLWAVHRWLHELDSRPVWFARRGDTAWRVHMSEAAGGESP